MGVDVLTLWAVVTGLVLTAVHFGHRVVSAWRTGTGVRAEPVRRVCGALTAAFVVVMGLSVVLTWHAISSLHSSETLRAASVAETVLVVAAAVVSLSQWSRVRRAFHALDEHCRVVARLADRSDAWLGHMTIEDLHLTPRQAEVFDLICNGTMSDAEIAEALVISPHTAGTHVRNILAKSELSNRRDLMLLGLAMRDEEPAASVDS